MRKRLIVGLISLIMVFTIPLQASAATIMYWLYYIPGLDQYKMDFTYPTGSVWFNLHFEGDGGYIVDRPYNLVPTGIMYLTCNGTYSMQFYDSNDTLIGYFYPFQTTQIINPTCDSYPKATGSDDLGSSVSDQGGGNYRIDWTPPPTGGHSKVYKDGQLVYSGTDGTYTGGKGSYTIINYDSGGNEVGRTDKYVPNGYDGTGGTGGSGETDVGGGDGNGGCNGCDKLREMLDCPEWGRYMGDLTQAIQNALPPPPDWDLIADKIGAATIRHLSDYLGSVPDAPSSQHIKDQTNQPLPSLDTSVPAADELIPSMPPDFNTPKPFDIEDGPQIEIVDNSQPFVITDPLAGLQIDDPGTPVIPGDSRNSSGGIKSPDEVDTGPAATPAPPASEPPPIPSGDPGNVPPDPMPTPTIPGDGIPFPIIEDSPIPIPTLPPEGG